MGRFVDFREEVHEAWAGFAWSQEVGRLSFRKVPEGSDPVNGHAEFFVIFRVLRAASKGFVVCCIVQLTEGLFVVIFSTECYDG